MPMNMMREFFRLESVGGILLALAAMLALVMENSPLAFIYDLILTTPVAIQIGEFIINKPLLLWINDGLMAIFFLLVGLEIKREVLEGQLSTKEQIGLPAIAAIGGLVVPAAIYSLMNWDNAVSIHGWAIPAATDIAFALGIVSLLGNRVPETLKITLVAIAIIDDLMAILIIAFFYTENLSLLSLGIGALAIGILFFLNKRGVTKIAPYVVTGIFLWACVLKSGVHATLAGVVLAFFIPLKIQAPGQKPPLRQLEHELHPWVAYFILPVFAFANAGVSLHGITLDMLTHPITLGIATGLFFGKQIGVMGLTLISTGLKLCKLPEGVNWRQFYGMALITGVGFTMSLFIGTLAFEEPVLQTKVRLGVILGSLLSGSLGYFILRISSKNNESA